MRNFSALPQLIIALIVVSGCSNDSTDIGPTPPPTLPPPNVPIGEFCAQVSLEATAATPGERVRISGLPSQLETAFATLTVPGSTQQGIAFIERTSNEQVGEGFALVVPVHPAQPLSGGEVALRFSNGESECQPIGFTVGSLANPDDPTVEGSFSRKIASWQSAIGGAAADLGVSITALKGDLTALPPEYRWLGNIQYFLDHPDNADSLATVLQRGTVTYKGRLVPIDVQLLDALAHAVSSQRARRQDSLAGSASSKPCIGPSVLSSAEVLNSCMNRQEAWDYFIDTTADLSEYIGMVGVLATFDPVPGDEALFANLATGYALASIATDIGARQAPKTLDSLNFLLDTPLFTKGGQEGRWSSVSVTVSDSEGFRIPDIVGMFFDKLTSGKLLKNVSKPSRSLKAITEILDYAKAKVIEKASEIYPGGDVLPIRYSSMGAVDITTFANGDSYESMVDGARIIEISHETQTYKPVEPLENGSTGILLVTKLGYFGSANTVAYKRAVRVEAEEEEKATLQITRVDWPEDISVYYEFEGEVAFPLTLVIKTTACTIQPGGCASGGSIPVRQGENPIVVYSPCPENSVGIISARFTLKDSKGITSNSVEASDSCP